MVCPPVLPFARRFRDVLAVFSRARQAIGQHIRQHTTLIIVDRLWDPAKVGGMSQEKKGSGGAAAPRDPVVARRVPLKVRRLPRACAPEGCDGYYHVVRRINGRARLLTDTRREAFRELLGRVADFCGVEVLT